MTRISFDIPEVYTDRLILRAPRIEDLEHITAFFQTERSRHVGGPRSANECWRSLSNSIGHWYLNGYGMWAMHHKADDRAIGSVGFLNMPGWHEPELAWHLYDGYEGQSYAYEAAKAARAMGAAKLGLDGVMSYIALDNDRSRALALRLGAVHERDVTIMDTAAHLYRHPKGAPQEGLTS